MNLSLSPKSELYEQLPLRHVSRPPMPGASKILPDDHYRHHFLSTASAYRVQTAMRGNGTILFIMLAGLLIRLAVVPYVHHVGYTSDEREYVAMALRLINEGVVRDSNGDFAVRAPLYPAFLAALLLVSGGSVWTGHLAGCLLGTLTIGATHLLTRRIAANTLAAQVAAAVVAFHPSFVIYAGLLHTETLYVLLFSITLLLAYRLLEDATTADALLLGITAGLAALTRAVFLGFFPILIAMLFLLRRSTGLRRNGILLLALAAGLAILTPWTIRNYQMLDAFVPVSSGGGGSLLNGNNPYASGTWKNRDGFDEWFVKKAKEHGIKNVHQLNEVERNAASGRIAGEYIAEHPLHVLSLAAQKAYIFWIFPITNSDSYIPFQFAAAAADGVVYLLAVIGIVATWSNRRKLLPVYGATLFFFLTQVVLHSEARFRLPLVPLLALFAGIAVALFVDARQRKEFFDTKGKVVMAGALIAAVLITYAVTGVLFLRGVI